MNTVQDLQHIDALRNPEAEAAHARILQEVLSAPKAGPMPPEPPAAPMHLTQQAGRVDPHPQRQYVGNIQPPINSFVTGTIQGAPAVPNEVLASLLIIKLEQLEKEHAYYLQLYRQLTG